MIRTIRLHRGLNLPVSGTWAEGPAQTIPPPRSLGLVASDHTGLKPSLLVQEGSHVQTGQPLWRDNRTDAVFVSPGTGIVRAINRGDRRRLLSVVIQTEGQDSYPTPPFTAPLDAPGQSPEQLRDLLLASGLWPALLQRPFGITPPARETPAALFVNAMASAPHALPPFRILRDHLPQIQAGLILLRHMLPGTPFFFCQSPEDPWPDWPIPDLTRAGFTGPHPAGLPGTHIHHLFPVSQKRKVWQLDVRDLADIGSWMETGQFPVSRQIALTGPAARSPRVLLARKGVSLEELCPEDEMTCKGARRISGSLLSGRTAEGALSFLGPFHHQISLIAEEQERHFLGWLSPARHLFSLKKVTLGAFFRGTRPMNTALHGGPRALIPTDAYERLVPMDMEMVPLLRALHMELVEEAEQLGCLELLEEDLALSTWVCPSKIDHGANLRRMLNLLEKEG